MNILLTNIEILNVSHKKVRERKSVQMKKKVSKVNESHFQTLKIVDLFLKMIKKRFTSHTHTHTLCLT